MEKIKVCWRNAKGTSVGNALGYSTHTKFMHEYCKKYFDYDENAKIALAITPADHYRPIPGKFNVLFCLAPGTKVLTSDLRWVPIKDIKLNDELIGFDEKLGMKNKFKRTQVIGTSKFIGTAYRVTTTQGTVIASGNHKWVAKQKNKPNRKWIRTDKLSQGDKIVRWHNPWESIKNYDSGWLSGFLDGEGYITNSGNGERVGFGQNKGECLNHSLSLLEEYGFTYHTTKSKNKKYPNSTHIEVQVHKGLPLIGMIRPKRLLNKAHYLWENTRTWSHKMIPEGEVLSVENIGEQELIGTKTTTNTLIAEGFLTHNTMWEFLDLPRVYIEGINKADALVVPSSFCRDIFKKYTDNQVDVCWEGVKTEKYPYHERRKSLPFRFLWVGAPNPRKGYPLVLEAIKVFENVPDVEIYLKTTVQDMNWAETILNAWRKRKLLFKKDSRERKSFIRTLKSIPRPGMADKLTKMGKHKNIIFDTRHLSFDELIGLYNSAHCFLLPSFGEGWGLTLCEALSTGCPSIATNVTGVKDYFNDNIGYPLDYEIKEQKLTTYDSTARGYVPDTKDFISKMMYVIKNYDEALKKGKRASERMRNKFTWEQSAKRLYDIVGGYDVN